MDDVTGPTGANGLPIEAAGDYVAQALIGSAHATEITAAASAETPIETVTEPSIGLVARVEDAAKADALAVLATVRPLLSGVRADISEAVAYVAELAPEHLAIAEALAGLPDDIRAIVHGIASLPADVRNGAKHIATLEEKGRKAVIAFLSAELG